MDKEQRTNYEAVIEKLQRENEQLRMSKLKGIHQGLFDCPVTLSSVEEFLGEHWHICLFSLAAAVTLLQVLRGDK
jgi:hypothetical protein